MPSTDIIKLLFSPDRCPCGDEPFSGVWTQISNDGGKVEPGDVTHTNLAPLMVMMVCI